MTMPVSRLQPGQAFRVDLCGYGHIDYRLLYANDCRAYVEPLMKTKRTIAKKDALTELTGETVLAEFDAPGGRVNIAPSTACTPILEDGDDEDLTGPCPYRSKPAVAAIKIKKTADIYHAPQIAKRPVRPKTTRAEMLAAIQGGMASLKKLAAKFEMKEGLVKAHIWEMWNSCGYGYSITGDAVEIEKPLGNDDGLEDLL